MIFALIVHTWQHLKASASCVSVLSTGTFFTLKFNYSIYWLGWNRPINGLLVHNSVVSHGYMFKLPPVNSIDFGQKWHWFLPIWNDQGVHKTDKEVITILPACRIPQKDLRGHESLMVKNEACKRPTKCTTDAALQIAPSMKQSIAEKQNVLLSLYESNYKVFF